MRSSSSFLRFSAFALALAALLFAGPAKAAPAAAPAPAAFVQDFYTAYLKHPDSSPGGIRKIEKQLSKGLATSIHAWEKRSAKNVPKGDVGDVDVDLFTTAQENPTAFKVGAASVKGDKAEVPITFSYDKERDKGTVVLVQEDGVWKFDNLVKSDVNLRKMLDSADLKKY